MEIAPAPPPPADRDVPGDAASTDAVKTSSSSKENEANAAATTSSSSVAVKYDEEEEEEDVCRICRNPGDADNPLRYPCACSGSIKFVHQDCLLQWLNHSNARQCEVCKHAFSFSPVYAENAPARLPFQEFVVGMAMKTCHVLQFFLRLSFVLSVWLLIIPFITFWIWRLAFVRSFGEAQRLFLSHLSTTVILTDCLHGFLLSASIVFIFLGATSLRDYFRHLRELGGQDADREDEGERNGARAARRAPGQANRNFVGDANGEDAAGAQGIAGAGLMIRRNAENVAARWEMQAARLEAHVEQMFDGLDDADGAEDVPFDELVGMQGPVFHLVENAFTVLASNMIFLGVVIFVPFSLGRIILYHLSWLFSTASGPVLSTVVPLTESALSLANVTLKNAVTAVTNASSESQQSGMVDQVAEILKVNMSGLNEVSNNVSSPLSADFLKGATLGTSRLSDVTTLAIGYLFIFSLVFFYLGIVALIRYTRGEPLTMGRFYGIASMAETIPSLFRQLLAAMRHLMTMIKVAFLLVIELGVFPLMCGWWLDVCTIRMFGKSMSHRVQFFSASPLASSLVHWVVGIVYMLQISIFVSLLRGVLRNGVLYFLRDPADPNYNPFRDLIDDPVHKHARRVLLSVAVYGSLIVMLVFLPVKLAMRMAPSIFPLDISVSDPFTEIPADMLLFQICIPFAIEHFKLRTTIKSLLRYWFTAVGWALGLTDFLLPRPEDNAAQENGNAEPGRQDRLQVQLGVQDQALVALPGGGDPNGSILASGDSNVAEEYDTDEQSDSEPNSNVSHYHIYRENSFFFQQQHHPWRLFSRSNFAPFFLDVAIPIPILEFLYLGSLHLPQDFHFQVVLVQFASQSHMGPTGEDPRISVLSRLAESVKTISELPECRNAFRKIYGNFVRRVKLLSPLFEELRDSDKALGVEEVIALESLGEALNSAKELIKSVNQGSKLYQALQRDKIIDKFHQMTVKIEAALSKIPYDKFDMSEEVCEQIELVHTQFKRAKERKDTLDSQLEMDLSIAVGDNEPDPVIIKRLSEMLHLRTINDLKKESLAFHELVIASDGAVGDHFEKMQALLKKLKDLVLTENPEVDNSERDKSMIKHRSPVIPDDFRCPISLELMKDPVIVSTGQTYERSCIQKWLDAGHKTCPKTQQTLLHTAITPNYVLKSLIALWCESNGVELPKKQGNGKNKKAGCSVSDCDRASIASLLEKLAKGNSEEQRAAAGELRLLAKRNADNRVCIAEAGAIPLLVELLSASDPRTQEHAVTALLNLSINESNKGAIVNAGAIPDIVDVLKNGSMEARENAAATLFSLSVVDENKVAIGAAGAIPSLIKLLCEGTPRGKKDAATAIFNLSIYQGNKARAIRAGIVAPLMRLLKDAGSGMVDEALAILAILASHQEGKMAIAQAEPISVLVEVIRTGFPRNRENAAAVLWSLCTGDIQQLKLARELGAEEALKELSENGTDRAKRKAGNVLEQLQRVEDSIDL